jgi:hypothetical protein
MEVKHYMHEGEIRYIWILALKNNNTIIITMYIAHTDGTVVRINAKE